MRRSPASDDHGFTLIELMVVVLIIAVLLAIAIPTFLAARNRASDRLAQTSLRTALNNARVSYSDDQTFALADENGLRDEDASVTFINASTLSDDGKKVSVDVSNPTRFVAAASSRSGSCFFLVDAGGSAPTAYLESTTLSCRAATGSANLGSFATSGW